MEAQCNKAMIGWVVMEVVYFQRKTVLKEEEAVWHQIRGMVKETIKRYEQDKGTTKLKQQYEKVLIQFHTKVDEIVKKLMTGDNLENEPLVDYVKSFIK